jgi:ABC-type sugar transport system ATPase subunit
VYNRPSDRFVASFLGRLPMNFLTGTLSADGSVVLQAAKGPTIDFGRPPAGFRAPGGELIVGIRPEAVLASAAEGATDAPGSLTATVTLTEVVAPDTYVTASVDGWSVRARTTSAEELQRGDSVQLRFSLPTLHFFDAATERRLEDVWAEVPDVELATAR